MQFPKPDQLPHYTYEDYLRWEGNWELISGIPYAMSPSPNFRHQRLSLKSAQVFEKALEICGKCSLVQAFDWKVSEDTIVQPDLSIVCGEVEMENFIPVVPALVLEILSPSTARNDRGLKYELYEIQGVVYYLIIHPLKNTVEIFMLSDGKYELANPSGELNYQFRLGDCMVDMDFNAIWN